MTSNGQLSAWHYICAIRCHSLMINEQPHLERMLCKVNIQASLLWGYKVSLGFISTLLLPPARQEIIGSTMRGTRGARRPFISYASSTSSRGVVALSTGMDAP